MKLAWEREEKDSLHNIIFRSRRKIMTFRTIRLNGLSGPHRKYFILLKPDSHVQPAWSTAFARVDCNATLL